MKSLYININGEDIQSTDSIEVIGSKDDAIINSFYYTLGAEILRCANGIGPITKSSLITDFAKEKPDEFKAIETQWEKLKCILLGEKPEGEFTISLPKDYLDWLQYNANPNYSEIYSQKYQGKKDISFDIGVEELYEEIIDDPIRKMVVRFLLKDNNYRNFDQIVVNDNLVTRKSKFVKDIIRRFKDIDDYDTSFVRLENYKPIPSQTSQAPTAPLCNSDEIIQVGHVKFKMIHVEGGTFIMGATHEQDDPDGDEEPTHQVTLRSYSIGETPVTQELWQAVMGKNSSWFKGAQLPVENVSWNDCQKFIKKLNQKTGKVFRLPTEAEWEFAARGGKKSKGYQYSGSNDINEIAWYVGNSSDETHPVKTKKPNELGIYDMSGNVWEWCQDWYDDDYYKNSPKKDPKGPKTGSYRVLRGGDWLNDAWGCRVSCRFYRTPDGADAGLGLRLALSE